MGRGTWALGALGVLGTAATAVLELGRVWKRGSAPMPGQPGYGFVSAGRTATRETAEVVRRSREEARPGERSLLHMLASFAVTLGAARAVTALIRSGRGGRLLRNVRVADRHIHHFVPGMVVAILTGGTGIAVRREGWDAWLAVPFGAGTALVLDEAALLLELEDVYWSEEGVLSLQLSFAALALLSMLALAVRLLRRGERAVLTPAG
jgi:hypothetical protein